MPSPKGLGKKSVFHDVPFIAMVSKTSSTSPRDFTAVRDNQEQTGFHAISVAIQPCPAILLKTNCQSEIPAGRPLSKGLCIYDTHL